MMKIAIDVNGVLRDTIGKLKQVYEKFLVEKNEDVEEIVDDFKYEITEPIDSLDISKFFKFKSKEEQFEFLYEEFPMHIFGHAGSTEMTSFNDLNDFYIEHRDGNELTIISDEIGKSKPATLFFLSKFGSQIERVLFFNSFTSDEILSSFDLIVTSNPNILINYPNKVIKFETEYNVEINSEHSIKNLKGLSNKIKEINAETFQ